MYFSLRPLREALRRSRRVSTYVLIFQRWEVLAGLGGCSWRHPSSAVATSRYLVRWSRQHLELEVFRSMVMSNLVREGFTKRVGQRCVPAGSDTQEGPINNEIGKRLACADIRSTRVRIVLKDLQ